MIKTCDLKNGTIVDIDGAPHVVHSLQVQTPSARGGSSLYKIRFRNIITKQKRDESLRGDDAFKETDFSKHEVQFLYSDVNGYTFMDVNSYDQFTLNKEDLGEQILYLVDDMEDIKSLIVNGSPVAIELPPVIELKIEECPPSMRGASATARTKPATLSTGLIVQVPEHISPGEVVKVDTRTGKFLSRA